MPGQIISIYTGGTGVRIGADVCPQLAIEHGIAMDGTLNVGGPRGSPDALFHETLSGKMMPRALFIGDHGLITSLKNGGQRRLYGSSLLIAPSVGHDFSDGLASFPYVPDEDVPGNQTLRRLEESCDQLDGYLFCGSLSGAMSVQTTVKIRQKLEAKKSVHRFSVWSDPVVDSGSNTDGVQTLWAMDQASQDKGRFDSQILLHNKALYHTALRTVDKPNYQDMNKVAANIIGHVTVPLRSSDPKSLENMLQDSCRLQSGRTASSITTLLSSCAQLQQPHQSKHSPNNTASSSANTKSNDSKMHTSNGNQRRGGLADYLAHSSGAHEMTAQVSQIMSDATSGTRLVGRQLTELEAKGITGGQYNLQGLNLPNTQHLLNSSTLFGMGMTTTSLPKRVERGVAPLVGCTALVNAPLVMSNLWQSAVDQFDTICNPRLSKHLQLSIASKMPAPVSSWGEVRDTFVENYIIPE